MIFKRISLESKALFDQYLVKNPLFENYFGSELNFQNLFVWKDTDLIEMGVLNGNTLLVRTGNNGTPSYFPPIARNWDGFFVALRWIESDCVERNMPFVVRGLTGEMAEAIRQSDLKYRISEDRDMFEYLYSSADLRTLAGKKFHNKRNLLHQFENQNRSVFKAYEPTDLPLIMNLLSEWEEQKLHTFEHEAIINTLQNLDQIGCFADLLLIEDKAVAFAIGTKNAKMGLVLFEKANTEYTGVYTAMNYQFANRHFTDVPIINRQEDIGIAELRKAKLSYNPIDFAEKFTATRNHISMEEVEQLKSLYHEAFDDSEGFLNYFFNQKYRAENVMFRKQDHHIVSALHFIPKTLSIQKELFFCPFVVAAATLKRVRGQGLMHSLIRQSLTELYNRKVILCGLSPFSETFYAETGFVTVNRSESRILTVPKNNLFTDQVIDRDHLDILNSLYLEKMQQVDVYVHRDEKYWQNFFDEVAADHGEIILVKDNDIPIGYFTLFEDGAEELCFPDENNIQKVDRLDQTTIVTVQETGPESHAMIRIVDVKKMLTNYPYEPTLTLSKRLKITDQFFELNNVTVELVIQDGHATLRDIEEYDEEISIEELTKDLFCSGSDLFKKPKVLLFDKY